MKKAVVLLTLSAILAACGGVQSPSSNARDAVAGAGGGQSFRDNLEQFEATVNADLKRLERPGLAGQAVTPFVYLNVLKLPSSTTTVRAYFKTNASSGTACSIAWGDGSSDTPVPPAKVPTTARIDTFDHTYSTGGSYTVTATCAGVGSGSVSVTLPTLGTTLTFEGLVPAGSPYSSYQEYFDSGYRFFTNEARADRVLIWSPTGLQGFGYLPSPSNIIMANGGGDTLKFARANGSAFQLLQLEYGKINTGSSTFTITGFRADNSTVTKTLTASGNNPLAVATFDTTWTNLVRVEMPHGSSSWNSFDNIKLVP